MNETYSGIPPSTSITPLSSKDQYHVWTIRVRSLLISLKQWDSAASLPTDNNEALATLIPLLSDSCLQMVPPSYGAVSIWKYFSDLWLSTDLSAKAAAITALTSFDYSLPTMMENKVALMNIKRDLLIAFGGKDSIKIADLTLLIAMVRLPFAYQNLREKEGDAFFDGL